MIKADTIDNSDFTCWVNYMSRINPPLSDVYPI